MPIHQRRDALALAAIVTLALALRLAWIAYADFEPTLSDDAGRYDFLGRSLAEGRGYTNPNGNTTMFWPPGYPFVLTAVYKLWPGAALGDHEVTAALVLNATLSAATVVLTYAIARRAFGASAALMAAALLAFFPSMIFFANVTLTETAFTFLMMLTLWLFIEAEHRRSCWWFAAAAIVAGYASLVRGLALLVPLVLAPFWLRSTGNARATLIRMAAATVAVGAIVVPWTARNFIESNAVVAISSNAGVDFYIGHSQDADGRGRNVDELVFRYPELPPAEAEARVNRDGFREGIEWALRHPLDEIELSARKVFFLWYRDDEGLRWNDGHGERSIMPDSLRSAMIWLSNIYYWTVMALSLGGAALVLSERVSEWRTPADRTDKTPVQSPAPRQDAIPMLLVSLILYWTLAHVAFFGDPRFHAPVVPVVCIFAATAVARSIRHSERSEESTPASSTHSSRRG